MRLAYGYLSIVVLLALGCGETDDAMKATGTPSPMDGADVPDSGVDAAGTDAPPMAMAGSGAGPGGAAGSAAAGGTGGGGTQPGDAEPMMAMDECDLETGYEGDEYCILPPPPGEGFQLHIGPDDYDNIDPQYILEPGEESTDDFGAIAGNETDVYFFYRQFRMRPGTHHMIITQQAAGGGSFGGRRIGTANASLDSPVGGVIAPENQGVGIDLPAKANLSVSLHSINVTDMPIIREIWVNFWYRDAAEVTETAEQLFAVGDPSFSVAPGEDTILGPYSCDIQAEGRMLWFYGHRHANNKRFSAWRVRGQQRDLFYEGFDWEEPLLLEYTSLIENPVPDRAARVEGGWTGILDLQPGDKLEWECHVVNEQPTPLRFTNNTYTGEMCIMDAELVGTNCTGGSGFGGF